MSVDEAPPPVGHQERIERRATARFATDMTATLQIAHVGSLPCRITDVGASGACVETASMLALDEVRSLTVTMGASVVRIDARATWQRPATMENSWLMGLHFRPSETATRSAILEIVRRAQDPLLRFITESFDLDPDLALDIASATRFRHLSAGAWLSLYADRGGDSESWYMVVRGSVNIEMMERPYRSIAFPVARGGTFGGMTFVSRVPFHASAHAQEDTSLLEVSSGSLDYLTASKPNAALAVRSLIADNTIQYLHLVLERLGCRAGATAGERRV